MRITLSDIARHAGMSKTTVSLALRNSPSVSKATRERIRSLAEELGYRRNFAQAEAAAHRWKSHPRFRGTLAYLHFPRRWGEPLTEKGGPEAAARFAGFSSNAERLSYKAEFFSLNSITHCSRIHLTLQNRGIHGICLGPVFDPATLDALHLSDFSVVSAHTGTIATPFHQVRFDWFEAFRTVIEKVVQRGYRHIGVALLDDTNAPTTEQLFAGALYHAHLLQPKGVEVVTRMFQNRSNSDQATDLDQDTFLQWVADHHFDAIIGFNSLFYRWLGPSQRQPTGPIGFAAIIARAQSRFNVSGTFEEAGRAGRVALVKLHGLLDVAQTGLPRSTRIELLRLPWHESDTLPQKTP